MDFVKENEDADLQGTPSFAVANRTGGIGRTTITRLIGYMWQVGGVPLRLISVESGDEQSTSKLASLGDEVEQMTITPDINKVGSTRHSDAQIEHWTHIGDRLAAGGCLIDFGANAIAGLFTWAAESKPRPLLEDAPPLTVVVPITSVAQSAADGLCVLKRLYEVEPDFMKLRAVVVFNDKYDPVDSADEPVFKELRAFMRAKGIAAFTIPYGSIQAAEKHTFIDLVTVHPRDYGKRFGISPMAANTRLGLFKTWLESVSASASAVGLGPAKASDAVAA